MHWQSYAIYSSLSILSKGFIIQNFNPQKRQFLCHVTCTKFFTKSIQIIKKKTLHTSIIKESIQFLLQ